MSTPNPKEKARRDLSTGQVARRMRLSQQTVIRLCNEGKLRCYRLPTGSHFRRIVEEDAAAFARGAGLPWDDPAASPAP